MTPTFVWPTDSRVVSSGFTDPRSYGQHNAIDIVAPLGAPVRAIAAGRIIFAGSAGSCGLGVFVDHAEGWRSHYCHLDTIRVAVGDQVDQGQRIGDIGSTGVSTGPHLHLNLFSPTKPATGLSAWVAWVGKWAVDPLDYLTEEGDMASLDELARRIAYLEKRRAYEAWVGKIAGLAVGLPQAGQPKTAAFYLDQIIEAAQTSKDKLGSGEILP